MKERWKPVYGYEGYYEVSNLGNVRTVERYVTKTIANGNSFPKLCKSKLLSPHLNKDGYPTVNLRKEGKVSNPTKCRPVHILVIEAFKGPRPEHLQTCHKNGKRDDPRLSNLRYGTAKKNAKDRDEHGTTQKGINHTKAILTEAKVRKFRALFAKGHTVREVAAKYNINVSTVNNIKLNLCWKWVI